MWKLWTFLSLLSFLIIQFHGLSHLLENQGETNHNCAICESQPYGLVTKPNNSEIKIVFQTDIELSFVFDVFISKANLFAHAPPRAPPIA